MTAPHMAHKYTHTHTHTHTHQNTHQHVKQSAQKGKNLGLWYMLASAFFFSLMALLVKLAGARLPSSQVVLARAALALILSYVWLKRAGIPVMGGKYKHLLVLRGVLGFGGLTCFYYALTKLPLGDASTIMYMNPLFTTLFAAWFLKERVGFGAFRALAMSLCGVVLIAQPSLLFGIKSVTLDIYAVLVALFGAMCAGGAYVTVRALRGREDPMVVIFYFPLIATPLALPFAWGKMLTPTPLEWFYLLGVGVTAQLAQLFLTRGLYLEQAGRAMSISYTKIVFAFLWGAFLFNEIPNIWSMMGVVLVLGGSLLVAKHKNQN